MCEAFEAPWHGGVAALGDLFDRGQVDREVSAIVQGYLPEDFYTLRHGATILALGFGCGVQILRLATWGGAPDIHCVEPDPGILSNAAKVLQRYGIARVGLTDTLAQARLAEGASVDLLLLDPRYAAPKALYDVLRRYRVKVVLGSFDPVRCSCADLYRACCDGASRFNVRRLGSEQRVVGTRRTGPHVSVVVIVNGSEDGLARTLQSLSQQTEVELEVLLVSTAAAHDSTRTAAPDPTPDEEGRILQRGCFESVSDALAMAQGSYVAIMQAADTCDSTMFARMYDAAVAGREDIALCAYRVVPYSDGTVHFRYLAGACGHDLCGRSRSWAPGTLNGLDIAEILGRCLYRRDFLQSVAPAWDPSLGAFAAMVFQAQCLFAAARIVTLNQAYLEHWETLDEMTGKQHSLGNAAMVRRIFTTLWDAVMERNGNYGRELALRQLLTRLYLSLYGEQTGLRGRWRVVRAMLTDCLAPMRYGSRFEFFMRTWIRLI